MALLRVLECFLLLSLAFSAVSSQDFESSGQDAFGYSNGDKGPANWGSLHPRWSTCRTGRMQSPIDINDKSALKNQSLKLILSYNSAIVNLTEGPELKWIAGGGSLSWNNYGPFKVVEIHWHTPSEHTVDGKRFPLEGHIVHQGPNNETLVRGILYKSGNDDPFIRLVMEWNSNPQVVTLSNTTSDFYHYMGSLTTPPCDEGVIWIVQKKKLEVSPSQVQFFLENFGGPNARPIQPLNNRKVYKYNFP